MPRVEERELERLKELVGVLLERNAQLQTALSSRIVIEQAKGILSARLGIGVEAAFTALRSGARANRMKLRELARRVVEERETPREIEEALARAPAPPDERQLRRARELGSIRMAENESFFRRLNEHVAAGAEMPGDALQGFLCECGDADCIDAISLTRAEYEAVRADPTRFAIVPGHELPEIERVVETHERYAVVEKLGATAAVAEETDPRS
jgi:ANTAR domain-containing protein